MQNSKTHKAASFAGREANGKAFSRKKGKESRSRRGLGEYIHEDRQKAVSFKEEFANAEIASQIYKLRTNAGFSQRQLAAKVGTAVSVICRFENADYAGHSLMLRRIATALNKRVEIRFVPPRQRPAAA